MKALVDSDGSTGGDEYAYVQILSKDWCLEYGCGGPARWRDICEDLH